MGLSGQLDTGIQIDGGTDGTTIGNVGDSLKVTTSPSSATTTVPSWSRKLRYIDMNASTLGVARGTNIATSTTWTTVFLYSGSGYLAGLILNLETFTGWEVRLHVDTDEIFSFVVEDLTNDAIYDVDDNTDNNQTYLGISKGSHDRLLWHSPLGSPVYYASSVRVEIRRPTAGAKKFQAGLVVLSKET